MIDPEKTTILPIRPPSGGLDVSQPPQTIQPNASPELLNTHFVSGQLQTRLGFAAKYKGVPEPIISLLPFQAADGTFVALLAFGLTKIWQFFTDTVFKPVLLWNVAGTKINLSTLTDTAYFSIAVGSGAYTPHKLNSAAKYPTTGYENILAGTNGVDGVFIIIPSSDGDPLAAEILNDAGAPDGFAGAVSVAFYAGRLIICGTTNNPSEVVWSALGVFNDFISTGSGSATLPDDADKIQNALLMREFLIVYKEHSIYIGRRTGQSVNPIAFEKGPGGNIGTTAPMSVVGTADTHYFLGTDNVYQFTLDGVQPIGNPIRDELFGRIGSRGIDPKYVGRSFGAIIREYDEYWLFTASGNVPAATNVVTNGDMTLVFFSGTTNSNTTISSVPASVFPILRRLTIIDDNDANNDIPVGTTVSSYNSGASTITLSASATGSHSGHPMVANGDPNTTWSFISGTSGATLTTQTGGNIGGIFQRITRGTGAGSDYLHMLTQANVSTAGSGDTISALVWLKAASDATARIVLSCYTSGGGLIETKTRSLTISAGTSFAPYIYSFTSSQATFRKISIDIYLDSGTTLDIDAIQIVNITSIDPRFWYRDSSGYYAPGLLTKPDSNDVTLIPYISGSIGPWSCDTVWVYNYRTNSWNVWSLYANCTVPDTVSATSITIADLVGTLDQQLWRFDSQELIALSPSNLLGSCDGQVSEMSQKYHYDHAGFVDNSIESYWQSKDIDLDKPDTDKTISRITLFHERSHPPTPVTVGVSTDSGNIWVRQTINIRTGFNETYIDFFVTGSQIRFEVRAESPGFYFTGFSLKLITRGQANAY